MIRKPKARTKPRPNKGVHRPGVVVGIPTAGDDRKPVYSVEHADTEYIGAWSWPTDADTEIMRFMLRIRRHTWDEILKTPGNKHHEQPIDTLCEEAQRRITELGLDQLVEWLFRFSVSEKKRLWGFVTEGVFYVLWWDVDHQVYPLEPQ